MLLAIGMVVNLFYKEREREREKEREKELVGSWRVAGWLDLWPSVCVCVCMCAGSGVELRRRLTESSRVWAFGGQPGRKGFLSRHGLVPTHTSPPLHPSHP